MQESRKCLQLLAGYVLEGWHDGTGCIGRWAFEVPDQPLLSVATRPFHRQVGPTFPAFAIELVTLETAFLPVKYSAIID